MPHSFLPTRAQLLEDDARRMQVALPQELANLSLGLARVGHSGSAIWSAIAAACERAGLSQFKPQELANLAWSCVAGPQQDVAAVRRLLWSTSQHTAACLSAAAVLPPEGHAAPSTMTSFKPQELSSVLRAVAKAGLEGQQGLFDAAAAHCVKIIRRLSSGGDQSINAGERRSERYQRNHRRVRCYFFETASIAKHLSC